MPRLASSKRPACVACAPVKAPRSRPNSSLSISAAGSAAQLTTTNGRSRRRLLAVERTREQFLAGAGLAEEQDGRIGRGDLLDAGHHVAQPVTLADDDRAVGRGLRVGVHGIARNRW